MTCRTYHHVFMAYSSSETPNGPGEDAIVARDAARLPRRLHDAVFGTFDGIGRGRPPRRWANRNACSHGDRLRRARAVQIIELDHDGPLVGVTLRHSLDARLTAMHRAGSTKILTCRALASCDSLLLGSSRVAYSG